MSEDTSYEVKHPIVEPITISQEDLMVYLFLRKVLLLVVIVLLYCVLLSVTLLQIPQFMSFFSSSPIRLTIPACGLIVSTILLYMVKRIPFWNMLSLFLFTTFVSVIVAFASGHFSTTVTISSLGITLVFMVMVFFSTFFYRKKHHPFYRTLIILSVTVLICSLSLSFFMSTVSFVLYFLATSTVTILIGAVLVYNVTNLMANVRLGQYSANLDDYVSATVTIFTDVLSVFLLMLAFLGGER
ncbi:hypothetical protein P9112_001749 [Eukaryota sp. TZLM1-RC]